MVIREERGVFNEESVLPIRAYGDTALPSQERFLDWLAILHASHLVNQTVPDTLDEIMSVADTCRIRYEDTSRCSHDEKSSLCFRSFEVH